MNFKFCFKIPAIVAVAIAALIAAARVADVPAARSTAITVHVPVARSDSTKMQEKKEIKKLSNFYYFYYFLLMMKICFDIDFNKAWIKKIYVEKILFSLTQFLMQMV